MLQNYKKINNYAGWIVFLISAAVYLLTIEPSASLWDCGEFIACSNKLEIGHPPGAPLFLMISRFFALFAGSHKAMVPVMINSMSALASGATILFLFWTITHLAKKFFVKDQLTNNNIILIIASGVVGSLAYTFSDTFWFSAVEGEVYAMSSLFTAAVFWAILKWEDEADDKYANRWIVLIGFLMGTSVGVHLLNLLTIPAIVLVIYFKKFKPSRKGVILSLLISIIVLAFVMYGIIQGSVKVASQFELFFVNSMNMPYNSGMILYCITLFAVLALSIIYSTKSNKLVLNTVLLTTATMLVGIPFMADSVLIALLLIIGIAAFVYYVGKINMQIINISALLITVIIIGYSSFALCIIRSNAGTPMNENAPNNPFSLLAYLDREQYGDRPLFYGPYYNSPQDENTPYTPGHKSYSAVNGKYIVTDQSLEVNYDSRFMTFFPRMFSTSSSHKEAYQTWGKIQGTPITFTHRNGKTEVINKPTFMENMRFFLTYQIGQMYFRYFMWNFAGRQNDGQGYGGITEGNWISGIKFIDSTFLGNQDKITQREKDTPSRNTYFFLPLILGVIGMVYMGMARSKDFWVVMLLFFFTGIAIVLYLNQTPYQPRERDYAYAGSFYAFAIWIGIGILGLMNLLKNMKGEALKTGLVIAFGLCTPVILAVENWDDHDRSGRLVARDFARNYLETCAPNAILFTSGDNDTFPLWYAQEVEGIRTDVRVVCLPLFATDWYIDQVLKRAYESAPLPISMTRDKYLQGSRDYIPVLDNFKEYIPLNKMLEFVLDDTDPRTKVTVGDNKQISFVPGKHILMPIDKKAVLKNNVICAKDTARIESEIKFSLKGSYIFKNELAILSMLNNNDWTRPMYYTSWDADETVGLKQYLRNDGFASRFVPVRNNNPVTTQYIDSKLLYDHLMHTYTYGQMEKDGVYLDEFYTRTLRIVGLRNLFNQCAMALISEHKLDSAIAVLDKSQSLMLHKKVPYDYYTILTAQAYYEAKAFEKGNKMLETYATDCLDELRYCNSLEPAMKPLVSDNQNRHQQLLQMIIDTATKYKQTALVDKINKLKTVML